MDANQDRGVNKMLYDVGKKNFHICTFAGGHFNASMYPKCSKCCQSI